MRLTTRASLRRPGGRNLQTQLRNRKGGLVAIARADGLPMSIAGIVSSGKRFHNGYIVNPQCHAPNLPPGTLFSWTDGREPGRADKRQAPSFLLDRLLGKRKKRPESRSLSTQLAEAVSVAFELHTVSRSIKLPHKPSNRYQRIAHTVSCDIVQLHSRCWVGRWSRGCHAKKSKRTRGT